ncbi:unnamed protein product [Zymoseptoria tritici ST99CH_3D7]|uniref:Uncharacterized protein n=1 Tax=Zymoseptoria tritici (strain ST99CH_3D7) TaxID=1276538 RepID=A0A1X7S8Q9_ZYMT9|nr:unnamed protein product [Zymoseptoria tritici ST99CH_3D7]
MKFSTILSFLLPLCLALVIPRSITDGSDHALIIEARQAVAALEATFEFVFENGAEATEEAEVLVEPPPGTGRAGAAGYAPSGTSITGHKPMDGATKFFFRKYDEFTGFIGEGEFIYSEAEHRITEFHANSGRIERAGIVIKQLYPKLRLVAYKA